MDGLVNPGEQRQSIYFVNGPIDAFFIGGASLVTCVLFALFVPTGPSVAVASALGFLTWVVNWPHFSMSSSRLYQSRAHVAQYPVTAFAIPIVVVGGVLLSFASPGIAAPYLVKLYRIWSPYHFTAQAVGITLIYARRSGMTISKGERLALSTCLFSACFYLLIQNELPRTQSEFFGIATPGLGLPEWTLTFATGAMIVAVVAFVGTLIRWAWVNQRMVPLIVLLPAVTHYCWFVWAENVTTFLALIPMFHSLQYILIAWSVQLKARMDIKQIEPSPRYVWSETARWGLLNLAGGATLFFVLPHLVSQLGYPLMFASAVVMSAVNIHHFFVDGVIWKLRKQTVASPVMMTFRDVAGSPALSANTSVQVAQ